MKKVFLLILLIFAFNIFIQAQCLPQLKVQTSVDYTTMRSDGFHWSCNFKCPNSCYPQIVEMGVWWTTDTIKNPLYFNAAWINLYEPDFYNQLGLNTHSYVNPNFTLSGSGLYTSGNYAAGQGGTGPALSSNTTYYAAAFIIVNWSGEHLIFWGNKVQFATLDTNGYSKIVNNKIIPNGVFCISGSHNPFTIQALQPLVDGQNSNENFTYQWLVKTAAGAQYNAISGATSMTYTVPLVPGTNFYKRVVSYSYTVGTGTIRYSDTSTPAEISFVNGPKLSIAVGDVSIFGLVMSGFNPLFPCVSLNNPHYIFFGGLTLLWNNFSGDKTNINCSFTYVNPPFATDESLFPGYFTVEYGQGGCPAYNSSVVGTVDGSAFAGYGIPMAPMGTLIGYVEIGGRYWLMDNFKTPAFNNGDTIAQAKNQADWQKYNANGTPAVYVDSNADYLYNKYVIYNQKNDEVCPVGWHVANAADWQSLAQIGPDSLKANTPGAVAWTVGTPNNAYSFNAVPVPDVGASGTLGNVGGAYSYWWIGPSSGSIGTLNTPKANALGFLNNTQAQSGNVYTGCAVRCVKN